MSSRLILNETAFEITINRLCFELIENHNDFSNTVLIGIQPRGKYLANRLCKMLREDYKIKNADYVIYNNTLEETRDVVKKIHEELIK